MAITSRTVSPVSRAMKRGTPGASPHVGGPAAAGKHRFSAKGAISAPDRGVPVSHLDRCHSVSDCDRIVRWVMPSASRRGAKKGRSSRSVSLIPARSPAAGLTLIEVANSEPSFTDGPQPSSTGIGGTGPASKFATDPRVPKPSNEPYRLGRIARYDTRYGPGAVGCHARRQHR
jgi:hypothetical protein